MNDKRARRRVRDRQSAGAKQTDRSGKRNEQTAEDDCRLDAELTDSFPASDPPSILRRGPSN
jgi:hypothetical protein